MGKDNVESFSFFFFCCVLFQCRSYKHQSNKPVQGHNEIAGGPHTSIFELNDCAYLSADPEESMYVKIASYTKYVSISLI